MKRKKYNVELVSEYAKDLTYEQRFDILLKHQDWVVANQNKRQWRLEGKVDYIITDSPILLAANYIPHNYYIKNMKEHVITVFSNYNNINFFINRGKSYVPLGRTQTAAQAKEKDDEILSILKEIQAPVNFVNDSEDCPHDILDILEAELKKDLS